MPEQQTPTGWTRTNLAALGDYINGFAFNERYWSSEGLPIVRIAQITGTQDIVDRFAGRLPDAYRLASGDLIFSWSGTLAVVRWDGGAAWLNQHLFKVMPARGIERNYLFHLLQQSVAEMGKRAHGSTMKHIKRGELKEFEVVMPDALAEQAALAHVLDALDTTIHQTELIIEKLKQVKQGLLHDLLTRGIAANGELRPPQSQAPHLYKDSLLGWIPRQWSIEILDSHADISGGITLGRSISGLGVVELPYLRVANVQDGYLDLGEIKTIRVLTSEIPRYKLEIGDVLMNEGGDFDKLGRGAIWSGQIDQCLHQNHVFRVRCNTTSLDPHYLTAFSGSDFGRRFFVQASKQTTNLASINSTQLKEFPLRLPPLAEQSEINLRLARLDHSMEIEQSLCNKLEMQKSGLMDDLLTGRVRVTPLRHEGVLA